LIAQINILVEILIDFSGLISYRCSGCIPGALQAQHFTFCV
jgi:hypothetical protein